MSQVFVRSDQLQDIVFDIKLTMEEWKILFAVDGQMDEQALAAFLEIRESSIENTLQKLNDMRLLKPAGLVTETTGGSSLDDSGEFKLSLDEEEEESISGEQSSSTTSSGLLDDLEDSVDFDLADENGFDKHAQPAPDTDGESDLEERPIPMDDSNSDEDLDQLIGKLLDDEEDEPGEDDLGDENDDLEINLGSGSAAIPENDPTVNFGEGDFDLGSIFDEELKDEDAAIDSMLGTLDEPEVHLETPFGDDVTHMDIDTASTPGTGTILVVDDSVVIRKMVEIALENENYKIVAVATGKEALKYLDENEPDLIILDIMLSDVNGLDILKAIKASKQIPVVMLSAKDTPRETTKAKQLGADDFIPKPFKDEELVGKIKELIKK